MVVIGWEGGGSNRVGGLGWWVGLIPINHSKLTENIIGELSVKSQLTTHHYHKAMAI